MPISCLTLPQFFLQGGTRLFAKMFRVMDLTRFDVKADYDDKIPVPQSQGKPVPAKYRQFLQYFPMWATTPDFYRVTFSFHWPSVCFRLIQSC